MSPNMAWASAAPPLEIDQEIMLLETLKQLLTTAMRDLSGGEAGSLLETSRQISSTANDLMVLATRCGHLPLNLEEQQQRRKLLAELGQQRAFCRAMLRRWRRSLLLRRQLLALQGEPETYDQQEEQRLIAI